MKALRRLYKSFADAARGLVKAFREERNLRLEAVIGFLTALAGWAAGLSGGDWALLTLAAGFVIFAELTNSAVERLADLAKPRLDGYAKEIKDIMAAAVLTACVSAVIIGLLVFWPYLFA